MKKCKYCGELNNNDSQFCCNCGKTEFVYCEELVCPHCGAVNDKSYTHCINCGNELEHKATSENAQQIPSSNSQSVAVDLRAELEKSYINPLVPVGEESQCPNCGAELQINAVYCDKCGTSVATLHEHRIVKRKICVHCGRPNLTTAPYCTYCYKSLADAKVEEMQVIHETVQERGLTVKKTFVDGSSGKSKICNNCGTLNAPNELYCVNCGLKLEVEKQKQYCPNCGTENEMENSFCTKCQWSFDGKDPETNNWTCSECGALNEEDNAFCTNCGKKKKSQKGEK